MRQKVTARRLQIVLMTIALGGCSAIAENRTDEGRLVLKVREFVDNHHFDGQIVTVKGYLRPIYPDVALFDNFASQRGDYALYIDDRSIRASDATGRLLDLASFLESQGCTNHFAIIQGRAGILPIRGYLGIVELDKITTYSSSEFGNDGTECFVKQASRVH